MIDDPYQYISASLLCLLLTACSAHNIQAPIDSRSNSPGTTRPDKQVATTRALPRGAPIKAIPAAQSVTPAPATVANKKAAKTSQYSVRRGDTLHSIAWQHGLTFKALAAINHIRPPYTIYAGQRLSLRPGGHSKSSPRKSVAGSPASLPSSSVKKSVAAPAYNGKWVWPTRGRILRGFRPQAGGKKGIDIGGHADQPVKAAANGTIVYAGSGLVGYGRLIIVKHNDSLLSAYGHNSKLLVREGERVTAGQMIAKMGSSGTSRNELYFEIRKDGKPVNPVKYLPRK